MLQDENKHLNKIHCQKGVEVEKLTRTIHELKESILGYDATANAVRDYQRQITELNVGCSSFNIYMIVIKHNPHTRSL